MKTLLHQHLCKTNKQFAYLCNNVEYYITPDGKSVYHNDIKYCKEMFIFFSIENNSLVNTFEEYDMYKPGNELSSKKYKRNWEEIV